MAPNGVDLNPWCFGSEMTADGECQGLEASASFVGNSKGSSNKGLYMLPAGDRSPLTGKPNATPGANYRALILDDSIGQYMLHNEPLPRGPALAMSRGCQPGSFPEQVFPPDVPRSMSHNLHPFTLTPYSPSIPRTQSEAVREQKATPRCYNQPNLQAKLQPCYRGTSDDGRAMKKQGPQEHISTHTKQDSQGLQTNPAPEYRQPDINQDTEEDAEINEELSQDLQLNGKGRHEN